MAFKYAPGDKVDLVNDYGVRFSGKTILSCEQTTYGLAYKVKPTDTPWYAIPERNLVVASSDEAEGC